MPGDRRAGAAEHAEHVNAAAGLLESGMPAAEAARVLAGRLGCSQRQARRYVARAAESGRVAVPDETVVFTVRLPVRLAAALTCSACSAAPARRSPGMTRNYYR